MWLICGILNYIATILGYGIYIATETREWNVAIIIVLRTVSGASFLYLTSEDIDDERV